MTSAVHLSLAEGQDHDVRDWERAAAAVLRKAGRLSEDEPDARVWDRLTLTTLDGIPVTPLGTPELIKGLQTSGRPDRTGEWDNRVLLADPDAPRSAAAAVTDLESGARSLWLQLGAAGIAVQDLPNVLDKVLLDVAPVILDAPDDPVAAARAFADVAPGRVLAAGTNLGADPVGAAARRVQPVETDEVESVVAEVATLAGKLGCLALVVDGTAVHDLGASDGLELGYSLAVGAAYLRVLAAAGHDVTEAAHLLEFRYAATDEQFPTIAKLRAARRLWARVLELSGVAAADRRQCQHAVTSRPMMSKYDPWVNMLRTCVAAFAAGVGGADAVTVLPFDVRLGLPDAFSRRIARNTSALLVSESHLARVADPAGGSFAVEELTDDLALTAWDELGRIEESGGVLAALGDGSLADRVENVAERRRAQIATRERPLTGLTEFPNLHERLPERTPYADGGPPVRPYGEAFERLRDAPAAKPVFLATMGTRAAHGARAGFASNLFAVGGVEVVLAGPSDGVDAVVSAYRAQQGELPVVCLAGTDTAYAEWGAELVSALRESGVRWVILAGRPVKGLDADDDCSVGVNAVRFLTRTREQLA
ncbi:MAG: methylmalonyl-CoA mutase family protein [Actinomycetota bacterium]|nr:methylmalonyl-CoA mutase family protein [Actinomycetota bacterium]